jgi:hypothetical protein
MILKKLSMNKSGVFTLTIRFPSSIIENTDLIPGKKYDLKIFQLNTDILLYQLFNQELKEYSDLSNMNKKKNPDPDIISKRYMIYFTPPISKKEYKLLKPMKIDLQIEEVNIDFYNKYELTTITKENPNKQYIIVDKTIKNFRKTTHSIMKLFHNGKEDIKNLPVKIKTEKIKNNFGSEIHSSIVDVKDASFVIVQTIKQTIRDVSSKENNIPIKERNLISEASFEDLDPILEKFKFD